MLISTWNQLMIGQEVVDAEINGEGMVEAVILDNGTKIYAGYGGPLIIESFEKVDEPKEEEN